MWYRIPSHPHWWIIPEVFCVLFHESKRKRVVGNSFLEQTKSHRDPSFLTIWKPTVHYNNLTSATHCSELRNWEAKIFQAENMSSFLLERILK
jgi:hypothetical protein